MEIIKMITFFFKRFSFHNPKKERIVIFDEAGSDVIIKTILYDLPYVILPARGESFFISIPILYSILKKIRIADFLNTKELKKTLFNYYYLSCIEYMGPKIVITFIEYNFFFQWVSKVYKHAEFIAIENGRKMPSDYSLASSDKKIQYYLPHFFCFGLNDADGYKKYGDTTIKEVYPVGSLKAGYYRAHQDLNKIKIIYDICLISTYRESMIDGSEIPEYKQGLIILNKFLGQFVEEQGLRLCIAMGPNSPEKQRLYYQKLFGENVALINQKPGSFFSSYEAIDSSDVIVSPDSTLGVEAFGFGKKILFCNFFNNSNYDINCLDLCKINVIDYDIFSRKLKYLLLLDQKTYLEQTEKDRKYLMNYDPDLPAHQAVRQLIKNFFAL